MGISDSKNTFEEMTVSSSSDSSLNSPREPAMGAPKYLFNNIRVPGVLYDDFYFACTKLASQVKMSNAKFEHVYQEKLEKTNHIRANLEPAVKTMLAFGNVVLELRVEQLEIKYGTENMCSFLGTWTIKNVKIPIELCVKHVQNDRQLELCLLSHANIFRKSFRATKETFLHLLDEHVTRYGFSFSTDQERKFFNQFCVEGSFVNVTCDAEGPFSFCSQPAVVQPKFASFLLEQGIVSIGNYVIEQIVCEARTSLLYLKHKTDPTEFAVVDMQSQGAKNCIVTRKRMRLDTFVQKYDIKLLNDIPSLFHTLVGTALISGFISPKDMQITQSNLEFQRNNPKLPHQYQISGIKVEIMKIMKEYHTIFSVVPDGYINVTLKDVRFKFKTVLECDLRMLEDRSVLANNKVSQLEQLLLRCGLRPIGNINAMFKMISTFAIQSLVATFNLYTEDLELECIMDDITVNIQVNIVTGIGMLQVVDSGKQQLKLHVLGNLRSVHQARMLKFAKDRFVSDVCFLF